MHRGRITRMGVVVVAFAIAWLPAVANAVSFGPPLGTAPFNGAPNNPYPCSVVVSPFLGPTTFFGPNGQPSTSCIWIHVPTPAQTQAAGGRNISLEPPGTGTVTQVHVAVGPTTGPMQVVVMRALYQNTITPGRPNDACCFPVARSQVFTPAANSISTVTVNLPVKEDATPAPDDLTTIADFDTLGLAVVAPNVPVPLYYTGDSSQPADFVWNTSTPSTVTPGFSTDTGGFFVALSGEWSAGGPTPPVGLTSRTVPVRNGHASVGLGCAASATCIGQLLLQNVAARGANILHAGDASGSVTAARQKVVTYGSASFKIGAHKRKSVAIGLSSAAKNMLKKHRSTKVWANVKLKSGSITNYAIQITLHR